MLQYKEELKLLELCLDANLQVLRIVDTIDVKERAEIILSITLELRKLCNKIIPKLEKYHKDL